MIADDGLGELVADERVVGFDSYDDGTGTINGWFSYGQWGSGTGAGNFRFFGGC